MNQGVLVAQYVVMIYANQSEITSPTLLIRLDVAITNISNWLFSSDQQIVNNSV